MDRGRAGKRILVFGAGGNGAAHLQSLKPHVALAGFVDNDAGKQGKFYCGHPVYSISDIPSLEYDHIFIASSWALDIFSQLVQSEAVPTETVIDYTLRLSFDVATAASGACEDVVVATGNSYAFNAFHQGSLERTLVNLAMSSQDIRTDCELLKFAMENGLSGKIGHVLIGVYHYIFDYEYEKRANIDSTRLYSFLSDKSVTDAAYADNFFQSLSENVRNSYTSVLSPSMIAVAAEEATYRSEKAYPQSREKNAGILESMLTLALQQSIQPHIVILPMHTSYVEGIRPGHLRFFYETIRGIAAKYGVPVLDGLRMPFPDKAFGDATHLNRFGSMLFSAVVAQALRRG
jgi:hypothetical protein